MEKANVSIFELCGSNYEIGYQLGKIAMNCPQLQKCKNAHPVLIRKNKRHK